MNERQTYGRATLYCALNETELNEETIAQSLETLIPIHDRNKEETLYLKDYLVGKQDIANKVKHTREEINNKFVENWTYAINEFMKSFILHEPIQYVQNNNTTNKELVQLNSYIDYEEKAKKDLELLEDIVLSGRGYRYVAPDKKEEEDEAPFELYNIDSEFCEIVYNSGIEKKQLFAFVETPMQEERTEIVDGQEQKYIYDYSLYTVYTQDMIYRYTTINGQLDYMKPKAEENVILYPKGHRIIEYYFNKRRFSILEAIKPLLDKINQLESLDMDDMEQFVNALMIFKNANITEETIQQGKELGALLLKSDTNMPADATLLQNRMSATDTQVFYQRLIGAMLSIIAMPYAVDNGSYGDTGVAKSTGQGWEMADQRSSPLVVAFGTSDKQILKYILKICRETEKSGIKNLKVSDIDIRFKVNKNANILEKTQALLNMKSAQISPNIAIPTSKIFNDDQNAIIESSNFYGENFWKEKETNDFNNQEQNELNKQVNEIQDIKEINKQKGV